MIYGNYVISGDIQVVPKLSGQGIQLNILRQNELLLPYANGSAMLSFLFVHPYVFSVCILKSTD